MRLGTKNRFQIDRRAGGLHISIGPRRSLGDAATGCLIAVWLSVLLIGSGVGIHEVIRSRVPPAGLVFLGLCAFGLLLFSGFAFVAVLWTIWGHEEISVTDGTLAISATLIGASRRRSFATTNVRNPRVWERKYRRHGMVQRSLAFDYEGQLVRTFSQLSAVEAEELAEELDRALGRPQRGSDSA